MCTLPAAMPPCSNCRQRSAVALHWAHGRTHGAYMHSRVYKSFCACGRVGARRHCVCVCVCLTTYLSIISVRLGELSTWQCVHAWLQYRPMFSCRMRAAPRVSGETPAACGRQDAHTDRLCGPSVAHAVPRSLARLQRLPGHCNEGLTAMPLGERLCSGYCWWVRRRIPCTSGESSGCSHARPVALAVG